MAGRFLEPWEPGRRKDWSNNQEFAIGVIIQVAWVANFSNAKITLLQDNRPGDAIGGPARVLEEGYDDTSWDWTVSYEGMDPDYNNVFYFRVSQADDSDGFGSHYFNITDASTTTSITASSVRAERTSSSSASPTTPGSAGLTTPQPTSPATVTVTPSNAGGDMPVGTIAGSVVGIVVTCLLLLGGAWWAWKAKKRRRNAASPRAQQPAPTNVASAGLGPKPYFYAEQQNPFETDGNQKPFETDGSQIHEMTEYVERPVYELQQSGGVGSGGGDGQQQQRW